MGEGGKATARDPRDTRMVHTFFSLGSGPLSSSVSPSVTPRRLVAFVLVLALSSRSRLEPEPSLHHALSTCSLSRSLRILPPLKLPTALANPFIAPAPVP